MIWQQFYRIQNFHASRGISGALYPQSATVGVTPAAGSFVFLVCPLNRALKTESCATGTYEPCQVRKEAALSKHFCVPRGSLAGVKEKGNA